MESPTKSLVMLFVMASLVGLADTGAYGENTKGKFGLGLRGGPSVYSQDVGDGVDGDAGPVVSLVLTYGITDFLSLGFNVEWETHNIDDLGVVDNGGGNLRTISLLPLIELRKDFGSLTPYAFVGAGLNFNTFDEDKVLDSANIVVEPDNTFAFKVGAGADYFITQNWAFNTELGWKLNKGDIKGTIFSGVTPTLSDKDDFNASAFSALFGIRYYFGPFEQWGK